MSEATLSEDGAGRFTLAGTLGFATVTRLLAAGQKAFKPHTAIEVEMAGVTRCDSAAVALLLEWVRVTEVRGATLAFRNLPASLIAIASISDVDGLLPRAS